jgi:hypothetical protein
MNLGVYNFKILTENGYYGQCFTSLILLIFKIVPQNKLG